MPNDPNTMLARTWLWLLGLSALSTLLASLDSPPKLAGAALLALAWAKARGIANGYLGLANAPALRRGFGLALALFMSLLLGLYLGG